MGLDRPPGAPPRGERQGLLKIQVRTSTSDASGSCGCATRRVSHSTTRRSSVAAQPAGDFLPPAGRSAPDAADQVRTLASRARAYAPPWGGRVADVDANADRTRTWTWDVDADTNVLLRYT